LHVPIFVIGDLFDLEFLTILGIQPMLLLFE